MGKMNFAGRSLRLGLSAALLLCSPGIGAYGAAAQTLTRAAVQAPLAGLPARIAAPTQDITPIDGLRASLAPTAALSIPTLLERSHKTVPAARAIAAPALKAPRARLSSPRDLAASGNDSLHSVRGEPNRLGLRFRQLRALFGSVSGEEVEAAEGKADSPALKAAPEKTAPAAPAAAAPVKKTGIGFGMSPTTWWFILSLLMAQLGVEALGSSLPALIQKTFGDFTIYAQVAVVSSIAGIVGRQLAPVVIEKVGMKKAYIASYFLRVAAISSLVALLMAGKITVPLMILCYSANALFFGVNFTAMNSVPPMLVGQEDASLNRFWGVQHTLTEVFGVLAPIFTGMAIAKWGFTPALAAFPIATLAAALLLWATLKLPPDSDLKKASSFTGGKTSVKKVFGDFFKKVARGAVVVWNKPALRYSFLGFTMFLMLNPFLYQMLAPGYALRLIGAAAPELAPAISGWLTGFYSAGGLLGGIIMTLQSRKLDKARETGAMSSEEENLRLNRSMLAWMTLGTATLAAFASMAVSFPALGALVSLPSWLLWAKDVTLPAFALIPFGVAQVVAQFKLQSYFQARVPKQDMADAMGFLGSASLAATTVGIMGLKYLFKAFPAGLTPFHYFALGMIPVGLFILYLRHRLSRLEGFEGFFSWNNFVKILAYAAEKIVGKPA